MLPSPRRRLADLSGLSVVDPNRAVRHGSLIKSRVTFIPELLKSAEDL